MALFKKKKRKVEGVERIIVGEKVESSKVEGYNRLKDNILYLSADGNNRIIQIESSVAHECKTTVICNLAVSLGLTDKKVVVVDLDFRKPRIHQRFDMTNDNGISEFMLGTIDKKQLIKRTSYKNVDIITRGSKIYNSSLVLVSDKFKSLIKELAEEYDYVLLDCAPVLQVSDYIHIAQFSDGVLFLVAYGITARSQVADAIKELKKNGAKLLGTVFTMYDRKKDKGYYGGYYGKYYYGKGYYSYYRSYLEDSDKEAAEKEAAEKEGKADAESGDAQDADKSATEN